MRSRGMPSVFSIRTAISGVYGFAPVSSCAMSPRDTSNSSATSCWVRLFDSRYARSGSLFFAIATERSKAHSGMQPPVAVAGAVTATLGCMWGDYWRRVCAPKLKAKKDELGRSMPEREIAAYVESQTGKHSTRALVSLWLLGEREPYISQFFALCKKLDVPANEVLGDGVSVSQRTPLRRISDARVARDKQRRKTSV